MRGSALEEGSGVGSQIEVVSPDGDLAVSELEDSGAGEIDRLVPGLRSIETLDDHLEDGDQLLVDGQPVDSGRVIVLKKRV